MATMKSQEASSSTSPCSYHVFLSFRGEDTRKAFTDHLYTALVHAGFRTFRDDDKIERGEDIKSELQKAIQESRISIIVLSKNYASSTWCLEELVMILKRRTSGHVVFPVFYGVDPSEVRKQIGSFKDAFTIHEEKMKAETGEREKEWRTKVEEWRAALREVANLAGMNLQNRADRHEARFIRKIIKVVGDKLSRTILDIAPYTIGMHSRAKKIQLWLEDRSADVGIVAICGMGGIGKTTIAKFLYNLNFSKFEGSSFLANVREISKCQDGLLHLQRQLFSDILQGRKVKINSVDEGIIKIKDAVSCKRVLVVLDDVDKPDQLDAVLGMRDWLYPGSKIIITTRREQLLRANEVCKVHKVKELDYDESLELFSWHAFGKRYPISGYVKDSVRVVHHCGGIPLAIEVLGSSLSGKSINVWRSQLEKLKAILDSEILEKLKISYDSLQDDHDKSLFLHLACFFVGSNKDSTVTILDGCEFFTLVGIQNLISRCLVAIDEFNTLVMHQLLQEMGREIVRQESPKEPGERSILWNHKDSFNVLRENTATSKIEGLILDMHLLKEDYCARTLIGAKRKSRFDEFHDRPLSSNLSTSLKKYCYSVFSSHLVATTQENSNPVDLEADAFARMQKLKLLKLNHVHISGPYENFPKKLKWLCWRGFPLNSIPSDFPLESLVALEMRYSSLKNVWEGTKFLQLLKILNLSHSHDLERTPDFSEIPKLERLILKDCASLVEVHESIGCLERLVLLNLKDSENLRKLPRSLGMLKSLEKLVISGCSNLEELPREMGNMESLTVLYANGTAVNRLLSYTGEVRSMQSFIRPWLLKPRKSLEISLPRSLVELSIMHCNLSDDAFPSDLSNLSSLKFLQLSHNPISSLPDSIRRLTQLEMLHLESCTRLRTLSVLHQLKELLLGGNALLEKVTFPSASHHPTWSIYSNTCDSLVEVLGKFKLEPIGNVDAELINNLGLSNLGSLGDTNVKLITRSMTEPKKLPLQGCHEQHIFCTYLPGSNVPPCFNFKNLGFSISFTLPSHDHNFRICGLSVCSIYELSSDQKYIRCQTYSHTIINNKTKGLIWSHSPYAFGIPEAGEDMSWLSYWKFENQLEVGDELNVSVVGWESMQVKEVGVHLVWKEEQEEKSTGSASEEEVSQQINPYGNVVPGDVSSHPTSTKLYKLGCHLQVWMHCPPYPPQPWYHDAPNNDEGNSEL